MKKYIRKLRKISEHSYSIVLPKELIKKFGWIGKQKITIEEKGRKRMELRDWKRR